MKKYSIPKNYVIPCNDIIACLFSVASVSKALSIENSRKFFEVDKMSESYHEIFDTQMPPELAAAQYTENSEAEEALEMGKKFN